MSKEIFIRPANLADVKNLARLWLGTFPDKFGPVLGEQGEQILCDWLCLSQRHIQTTTVIVVGGAMAGYIILETPSAPRPDSGRWLWRALQLHNGILGALWKFIMLVLIDNNYHPGPDEVYIEMLGIDPRWRGQGLATRLMTHTEAVARRENVSQLTLNVACDNQAAIKLYQKSGFEIKQTRQSFSLKWITGCQGYYKMVKKLD